MLRSLLSAVALLSLLAPSANGLNIYMVALDGPFAYTGGVPSLSNGGVGNNASGGGLRPSVGWWTTPPTPTAGLLLSGPSGTARMGLVIQLMNGTYDDNGEVVQNPNQLATATIFFNQIAPGVNGVVDLANVQFTAINDAGEVWHSEAYSTGMVNWVNDIRNGPPNNVTPPNIEDYHLISFDDTAAGGGGGNSFGNAAHRLWLHTIITVHARQPVLGLEARVVFDTGLSEFFNNDSDAYGFRANETAGHGGSTAAPGGFWVPKNGATAKNAFPIECCVPEPGSLLLALVGAALVWRRPCIYRARVGRIG